MASYSKEFMRELEELIKQSTKCSEELIEVLNNYRNGESLTALSLVLAQAVDQLKEAIPPLTASPAEIVIVMSAVAASENMKKAIAFSCLAQWGDQVRQFGADHDKSKTPIGSFDIPSGEDFEGLLDALFKGE